MVFDSSAEFNGTSLNNHFNKGFDGNNLLKGVLSRFRINPIGFTSDIEAMFNQFHVTYEDSNFLRFYWFRNNRSTEPLVQYRALVHIFGNKPSPAVANYGLKYVTELSAETNPEAKVFIFNHVYVDDGLCSARDPETAIKIIKSTRESLNKVGIRLCKIMSNSTTVMAAFPSSELAQPTHLVEFNDSTFHGTLGVMWNTKTDEFFLSL